MSEIVQNLVQCVTRAFYDTKQTIVMDAVLKHSALRDDHLSSMLGMQVKDIHKVCGALKQDRIVMTGSKADVKGSLVDRRGLNKLYYYVDYRVTVDAIKWRMHRMVKAVEDKLNTDSVAKSYVCPRCARKFSSLDVNALLSSDGTYFQCDVCGAPLQSDDESQEYHNSKNRLARLMEQMGKIIDLLKAVDDVVVPDNQFLAALSNAVPPWDEEYSSDYELPTSKSTASLVTLPSASLHIDFTSQQQSASEKDEARRRAAKLAAQNALPVWHAHSTVSGEPTFAERKSHLAPADAIEVADETQKASVLSSAKDLETEREIAEYYASLRKQNVDDASGGEDDDEFENVEMENTNVQYVNTPVHSLPPDPEMDEREYKRQKEHEGEKGNSEDDNDFEDF